MASSLCIGTLVRVKDESGIDSSWRGQLAFIIGGSEYGPGRVYHIRRLHDGQKATCSINGFDVAGEEANDG